MVTLDGELLVPGGAISGGAFKNNSNLLGRRRELEELEEKIDNLSLRTVFTSSRDDNAQAKAQIDSLINEIDRALAMLK